MKLLKHNVFLLINLFRQYWKDTVVIFLGLLFSASAIISFCLILGVNIPIVHTPQISSLKDKITVSLSFTTALFAITSFAINSNNTFKKNKLDADFMRSKYFNLKFEKFVNDNEFKKQYDYLVYVVQDMTSMYDEKHETKVPILGMHERIESKDEEYFSFLNERISFTDIEKYEKTHAGKLLHIKNNISKVFNQVHQDSLLFEALIKSYNLKMDTKSQELLYTSKYKSEIFMDSYAKDDDYATINYQIILEMWQVLLIIQKFGELAYEIVQSTAMLIQYSRNFSIDSIELDDVNYIFKQIERNKEIMNFMLRSDNQKLSKLN
ncbi:hypothetical protein Q8A50_04495 [Leuconostoc mesenteroides]|uniref:hypothetical protein n=1 Tax=Leuconostoc mesenteroides TaxID=1245 RepID=UPI00030A73D7|nr:hypothetical protein [Leuconostoc mesenteroides]MCT3043053.1 hypothetical protein [Leuconostoc mesenteroides]MDG9747163.1 hypothetical protein [Leuconostoc mesenteroides]MDP0486820.1 hypothetical protein [Leuconostoc mesenteroides]QQB31072.1 hypothetical protein I6H90_09595 [Leuconostoc mesenteroides]STY37191.1 Uncharacterised protein [Leuconostoc mesenteroides]